MKNIPKIIYLNGPKGVDTKDMDFWEVLRDNGIDWDDGDTNGIETIKYKLVEGASSGSRTGSSPVHNIVIQKIAKIIDEMIEDKKKYYDENGVCWLCYEDEFCYHQYKIEVLVELKKKFSNFSV